MPTFVYQGRTSDGKIVNGRRLAQSADNLSYQLTKENITPIKINIAVENVSLAMIKDYITGLRYTNG